MRWGSSRTETRESNDDRYQLMTSDVAGAADLHGAVVGWQARAFDGAASGYHVFSIAGGSRKHETG
jgi:hypothetical protein